MHLPALSSKFESSDDGTAVSAQKNENNYILKEKSYAHYVIWNKFFFSLESIFFEN